MLYGIATFCGIVKFGQVSAVRGVLSQVAPKGRPEGGVSTTAA
jgi:hypothetical protein